jgi:cbb3-type cytochrome oxidase maturation protein
MNIIPLLILASLMLAGVALAGFIWAVKTGQFEDTFTPSIRILVDQGETRPANEEAPVEKRKIKSKFIKQ